MYGVVVSRGVAHVTGSSSRSLYLILIMEQQSGDFIMPRDVPDFVPTLILFL